MEKTHILLNGVTIGSYCGHPDFAPKSTNGVSKKKSDNET